MVLADVQRHDNFLERRISGALADAIDRAFDLAAPASIAASEFATAKPRSSWQCALSTTFGYAPRCARDLRNMFAYSSGVGVADCVRQIDDRRAAFHGGEHHLAEKIHIGAAGVLRGKFHFFAMFAAEANHLA